MHFLQQPVFILLSAQFSSLVMYVSQ